MQLTPFIFILLISGAISFTLAGYAFRRYAEPEMAAFAYLMISTGIWAFVTAGEGAVLTVPEKVFWSIIGYAGSQTCPAFLLIFLLRLTRRGNWFNERYIPLLFIIPAASILIAGTNSVHHLLWTSVSLVQTHIAGISAVYAHGPWFQIEVLYSYLLLAISLIITFRAACSHPGVFSRQMIIILVASVVPITGNILYTTAGTVLHGIDPTPVLFTITGVLCWYAISRHRLFDIFPAVFQQIFQNMHEGVIVLDHRGRITAFNPAAASCTSLSPESIGMDAESVFSQWVDLLPLITGKESEKRIMGTQSRYFDISSYPVPTDYSGKDGRLVIIRDITLRQQLLDQLALRAQELEQTSEDLRRANIRLHLMTGIVRHDISNELMIIRSTLDMMDPSEESMEHRLVNRSREATDTIRDLIAFSHEYEEIGIRNPEWIHFRDLVAREGTMVAGKVTFENDIPAAMTLYTDPLIRTVIRNLIDNALRHGGPLTQIRFSLERRKDGYWLVCQDNGHGVAAEDKEKIFSRSFGKNTGMGLFLIREILSVSGMTIRETGTEGRGARFEIQVPDGIIRLET